MNKELSFIFDEVIDQDRFDYDLQEYERERVKQTSDLEILLLIEHIICKNTFPTNAIFFKAIFLFTEMNQPGMALNILESLYGKYDHYFFYDTLAYLKVSENMKHITLKGIDVMYTADVEDIEKAILYLDMARVAQVKHNSKYVHRNDESREIDRLKLRNQMTEYLSFLKEYLIDWDRENHDEEFLLNYCVTEHFGENSWINVLKHPNTIKLNLNLSKFKKGYLSMFEMNPIVQEWRKDLPF